MLASALVKREARAVKYMGADFSPGFYALHFPIILFAADGLY